MFFSTIGNVCQTLVRDYFSRYDFSIMERSADENVAAVLIDACFYGTRWNATTWRVPVMTFNRKFDIDCQGWMMIPTEQLRGRYCFWGWDVVPTDSIIYKIATGLRNVPTVIAYNLLHQFAKIGTCILTCHFKVLAACCLQLLRLKPTTAIS